ncbi:hypothetical protein LOZ66_002380 [Ophidiomyces ophidiicola]|nr:hypothetical protein LOZ66_002380 [Ophidiomyces ophidiicola]
MPHFTIRIVSDTVCPWCYVGKKNLDAAIALYQATQPDTAATDSFSVTWQPFMLNPHAPLPSIDKQAYYAQRFGADRAQAMHARVARAGAAVGIAFRFGGRTGSSRDSHRLIQLGHKQGVQTRVVEQLFAAYFEHEQDITAIEVLVGAGVRAGLDEREVREWLETGSGGEEVDREVAEARARGVQGVPCFVVQGRYCVEGAGAPGQFLDVFEEIRERECRE